MSYTQDMMHVPVMADQVKHYLVRPSTRLVVDMTVGTGGHALELLGALPQSSILVGLDLDSDALEIAARRLAQYKDRVILKKANFRYVEDVLEDAVPGSLGTVDAILADCGISKKEIVESKRGFSFDRDGDLDMRFDTSSGETAKSLLRHMTVEELADLFRNYGEAAHARRLAKALVARRSQGRLETTLDLAGAVKSVVRAKPAKSMARVFLAIRATVNGEMDNLARAIEAVPRVLSSGGRVAVISYHSVEDRVVKTLFNKHSGKCICPPGSLVCSCGKKQDLMVLTPRPLVPAREETASNPSARSAKLRVAEKM
ncbi:MAG TPA: 16S rRNA (cytosine(1402)-N(4))-methyltransferase RsmH [bacterium]|nr:16S rRNA (cytosine(1402)-N(4))-methyltransferase RsmH [bacterium]